MRTSMWKIVFLSLTVILIGVLIYLVIVTNNVGTSFVVFLATAFCGLLGNVDRLESFSASPTSIRATLTKITTTVDSAEKLIASLKKMQIVYAKAVFGIVADPDVAMGGKTKFARRDAIKQFVVQEAESSGLDESQIREILDIEKDSVSSEYAAAVLHYAHKALNGADPNPLQAALNPIMNTHPSPDQLEKILNDCKINDTETRSFIDDYRYYLKTGRQRRPEVWANRGEWMAMYLGFDRGAW